MYDYQVYKSGLFVCMYVLEYENNKVLYLLNHNRYLAA